MEFLSTEDIKTASEGNTENGTCPNHNGAVCFPRNPLNDERQRVEPILQQKYGLALTSCRRMDGFDDENYQVTVEKNIANPYIDVHKPRQFALRIINAEQSQDPGLTAGIHAVMKHIYARGIVTQEPVKNLKGEELTYHTIDTDGDVQHHIVVLRTFLPGKLIDETNPTTTDIFPCGVFIARLSQALEDFHHPFFDTYKNFAWSLDNEPNLKKMLKVLKDLSRRDMLETILDSCVHEVSLVHHHLKPGQIHGDVGFQNIIVPDQINQNKVSEDKDQTSSRHHLLLQTPPVHLWGLIDFHEAYKSFFPNELAISAVRVMSMDNSALTKIVEKPRHLIAGFQSVIPLSPTERRIFPHLVIAQLCIQIIGCEYNCAMTPGNAEYAGKTLSCGWPLLELLWKMTPSVLQAKWELVA